MEELVIAGVSQGAQFALELGRERSRPWLCIVPSFPHSFDVSAWSAGFPLPPGGFILGELDPARAGAQTVLRSLESARAGVVVRIMEGVGHALPEDFAAHVSATLDEIRQGNAAFFSRSDSRD
jgi:predicted esterase